MREILSSDVRDLVRRVLIYTYYYLVNRVNREVERLKEGYKLQGQKVPNDEMLKQRARVKAELKEDGDKVLKKKIENLSRSHNDQAFLDELSYLMASLAGEPGEEVLVERSTGGAGYVSWCVLRYRGWRWKSENTRKENEIERKEQLKCWLSKVSKIEVRIGLCARYKSLLKRHWTSDGEVDDSEFKAIKKHYCDEPWFKRVMAKRKIKKWQARS